MLDLQAVNRGVLDFDTQGAVQDSMSSTSPGDSLVFQRVVGSVASFTTLQGSGEATGVESTLQFDEFSPMSRESYMSIPQHDIEELRHGKQRAGVSAALS